MKDRLHNLIREESLSSSKFADKIGVQRSSISHILSGRNNPSMDFIQKVLKAFPHVNSDWLLLGRGEMYTIKTQPTIFDVEKKSENTPNTRDKTNQAIDFTAKTDNNVSNTSSQDLNKPTTSTEDSKILQPEADNLITGKKDKEIHKIVIFYKDRTFIEYYPE